MNPSFRLALGGGGTVEESRLLDQRFADWIGPHGKLLYIPVALRNQAPFESCYDWITSALAPFGVIEIEMWTDLARCQSVDLGRYEGVYIGGGNTYSLLAEMRETGFLDALRRFAYAGGAVYGGSAGAAVLGRTIDSVAHIDQNHVGLTDLSAMNLVGGTAVWVHHQPSEDKQIADFMLRHNCSVLALSEKAGAIVANGRIESVGYEPAYFFTKTSKTALQ